ncbi:10400_t:CDS:2 [Funneliformis caledonium]|uniref:10400_t:CDS:1 n=1 Tax=Funneliformis caledonium TaxID=1117310 RepID=A0A9N9AWD1_9GLOM|nr:10400_t:CDS:2 [Funneliformis caledonium]
MTSTSSMSESSTLFNISNRSPHNTDFNNGTNDPSNGVDFNSEYFQYSSPIQQYSSHGKLVPPPPPPMEMDILENDQILSSDEFNSIFESFATVVEGHNQNNNNNINYFNEDGGLKGVNYSNGLLEDEQLAKALSVIAMI